MTGRLSGKLNAEAQLKGSLSYEANVKGTLNNVSSNTLYTNLKSKPSINGIVLDGDISLEVLGINNPTKEDLSKIRGVEEGANNFALPVASPETLGGVKQGNNVTIHEDGTIDFDKADAAYIHDQIASSRQWTVVHSLDKYPSVVVVDSGGSVVVGDINYIDPGLIELRFTAEFSGKAYLN